MPRDTTVTEYFDLYDAHGRPLGARKERSRVHREGDWHRSVALWVVRGDGGLVLQKRSEAKDTRPGKLTATVSGHYSGGEELHDVLREADEEIGIAARIDDLIPLGRWRNDDAPSATVRDRELVDVFLWPLGLPLADFRPNPAEVSALVEIPAATLLRLLEDPSLRVSAPCLRACDLTVHTVEFTRDQLVPAHDYHVRVAHAALAFAGGTPISLLDGTG